MGNLFKAANMPQIGDPDTKDEVVTEVEAEVEEVTDATARMKEMRPAKTIIPLILKAMTEHHPAGAKEVVGVGVGVGVAEEGIGTVVIAQGIDLVRLMDRTVKTGMTETIVREEIAEMIVEMIVEVIVEMVVMVVMVEIVVMVVMVFVAMTSRAWMIAVMARYAVVIAVITGNRVTGNRIIVLTTMMAALSKKGDPYRRDVQDGRGNSEILLVVTMLLSLRMIVHKRRKNETYFLTWYMNSSRCQLHKPIGYLTNAV